MDKHPFKPAWWLLNPHFQTIFPTYFRKPVKNLPLTRERLELPDGDFIDLDWAQQSRLAPIVMILHGLEGSIHSPYAKGMLMALQQHGWRGVFMHFRGCSGEHNRKLRSYHSGETSDINYIARFLKKREQVPIAAVGFSLGGNVLVKWLGETGADNPLSAAVGICVPFELNKVINRMNRGFSKVYQRHLLNCLCQKIQNKFQHRKAPFAIAQLENIKTMREFDNIVTAPLHGFKDADDYYSQSSSRPYLRQIQKPTLLLQAKDDPFLVKDLLPTPAELPRHVQCEVTDRGGHVGFVTGSLPWRAHYWLEERVPLFLQQYL